MFIEETFEDWILARFRAAEALVDVTQFEVGEITIENVGGYVKRTPAVVFNVGEDNRATSVIGSRADANNVVLTMYVYVFVTNRFSRKAQRGEARPILRAVRNTLRGLRYTADDGATEGVARVFYLDQEKQGQKGPMALYLQRYEIHTQDFNDNRRTL